MAFLINPSLSLRRLSISDAKTSLTRSPDLCRLERNEGRKHVGDERASVRSSFYGTRRITTFRPPNAFQPASLRMVLSELPPKIQENEKTASIGNIIEITSVDQFDTILQEAGDRLVVADFFAKWCRKCLYIMPRYARISKANPDVMFLKVDVNEVAGLPQRVGIKKMPTFQYWKHGQKLDEFVGADSADTVEKMLTEQVGIYSRDDYDESQAPAVLQQDKSDSTSEPTTH
mmetsp:Transcript_10928/g.17885  ORF Transcript_10928/g.17885 Transcript_10928/m.17885 type:complete len:231 (+) Transcript_10928:170-862(+)